MAALKEHQRFLARLLANDGIISSLEMASPETQPGRNVDQCTEDSNVHWPIVTPPRQLVIPDVRVSRYVCLTIKIHCRIATQ